MEKLKEFVLKKKPDVIAVASISREATTVMEDIKMCLAELEQENQMAPIGVELVDSEVARIYQASPRSDVRHIVLFYLENYLLKALL
jgi:transcription elongation factor SPT6